MKRYLIILLAIFSLYSCGACKNKKDIIAYCNKLEGKSTNIRNLIDIDGYYPGIMFFEDGSFVSEVHFQESATTNLIQKDMTKWLHSWIDDNGLMQWSGYWGAYRIEGDTIITTMVNPGNFWRGWEFREKRYKVIHRTTIQCFYSSISPKGLDGRDGNAIFKFLPCDSIPLENNPLKRHKWFWKNESDWKNYMQMIKQKKAKK